MECFHCVYEGVPGHQGVVAGLVVLLLVEFVL